MLSLDVFISVAFRPRAGSELRSCVKAEVDVLGSRPYGLCGRKATLNLNHMQRPYGILGTGSPGRPPRLSHRSRAPWMTLNCVQAGVLRLHA